MSGRFEKLDAASRKVFELLAQAFSIVAALAWSEAVRSLFTKDGVLGVASRFGPWVYALTLTLFVFFITQMPFFSKYAKPQCTTLCDAPAKDGTAAAKTTYPLPLAPTIGMFETASASR